MSELFLYRDKSTQLDTPGLLVYNENIVCFTLEDLDRGLTSDMTAKEIQKIKVYGQTAIPYGRYEFFWRDSPKNGRIIQLIGVKGFSFVQMHPANWATQLLGCIAPGLVKAVNSVQQSKDAWKVVKKLILDNDIKFINIEKMK
jgi:hypothetical protein